MEPSPATTVTRFLIRFGRPLLRRRPAGGASAHFQIRIGNQPVLAPVGPRSRLRPVPEGQSG